MVEWLVGAVVPVVEEEKQHHLLPARRRLQHPVTFLSLFCPLSSSIPFFFLLVQHQHLWRRSIKED
jgi:hypothetical protein